MKLSVNSYPLKVNSMSSHVFQLCVDFLCHGGMRRHREIRALRIGDSRTEGTAESATPDAPEAKTADSRYIPAPPASPAPTFSPSQAKPECPGAAATGTPGAPAAKTADSRGIPAPPSFPAPTSFPPQDQPERPAPGGPRSARKGQEDNAWRTRFGQEKSFWNPDSAAPGAEALRKTHKL